MASFLLFEFQKLKQFTAIGRFFLEKQVNFLNGNSYTKRRINFTIDEKYRTIGNFSTFPVGWNTLSFFLYAEKNSFSGEKKKLIVYRIENCFAEHEGSIIV